MNFKQKEDLTENIPGDVLQRECNEEMTLLSMSSGFSALTGCSRQEIEQLFQISLPR